MIHDHTDFSVEVVERSRLVPVLADFWVPWCGPCLMLNPVLEKLAREARGRWTFVAVNVDQQPELAEQFGIRGIPSVKLFHRGEIVAEFGGALPEGAVRNWLEQHLPSPSAPV